MKHGPQPARTTAIRYVHRADDSLLLDHARLTALLTTVGPARSETVLEQLGIDLRAITDGLGPAIAAWHWPAAQRLTHNLVAIADTAGATRLADLARRLHADCHEQDVAGALAALPEMLDLIAALHSALNRHQNGLVTR